MECLQLLAQWGCMMIEFLAELGSVMEWLILLAQVGILIVAAMSVWIARKITLKRATLDFAHQYNNSPRVTLGIQTIIQFSGKSESETAEYLKQGGKHRENFLFVMNMLEILASGLHHRIYNRDMAIDMVGDDLHDIFDRAEPLIKHIRATGGSHAYKHLEKFAAEVKVRHSQKTHP